MYTDMKMKSMKEDLTDIFFSNSIIPFAAAAPEWAKLSILSLTPSNTSGYFQSFVPTPSFQSLKDTDHFIK